MKSVVIAVLALLTVTVAHGEEEEEVVQIKCYNCTIEETKYVRRLFSKLYSKLGF